MQWTEIKNAIGLQQCEGFGQQMAQSRRLYEPNTCRPVPTPRDLGIGITLLVRGRTVPALALKCPVSPASPDMASTPAADLATGGAAAVVAVVAAAVVAAVAFVR